MYTTKCLRLSYVKQSIKKKLIRLGIIICICSSKNLSDKAYTSL